MRVVADIKGALAGNPQILQVENTPALGELVAVNGKFVVPIVEGATITVDDTSHILPIDGGDIASLSYAQLLAMFPMYDWIYYNPLLEAANIGEFDLTATFDHPIRGFTYPTRAQVGRNAPAPIGLVPNNVALPPINEKLDPVRPGLLVTNPIDIRPQTNDQGTDEFMVYWKIYQFDVSDDVLSSYGTLAGTNTPAIRSIIEVDQTDENFEVWLSKDNAITWERVFRLIPMAFPIPGADVRLAFVNFDPMKYYLATYAFMF